MEQIIGELAKLGLPGLFIAYLIWRGLKADDRYEKLATLVNEVQERRATERIENTKAMLEAAAASQRLATSVDEATDRMCASVQAAVATMAASMREKQW